MKQFDRQAVKEIRETLQENLDAFGAEYGITFKLGNMRYSDVKLTTQLEVFATNGGDASDAGRIEWETNCMRYGLRPNDFGKTIELSNGTPVTLSGIKTRNRKYPIIADADNGRSYKLTIGQVEAQLDR